MLPSCVRSVVVLLPQRRAEPVRSSSDTGSQKPSLFVVVARLTLWTSYFRCVILSCLAQDGVSYINFIPLNLISLPVKQNYRGSHRQPYSHDVATDRVEEFPPFCAEASSNGALPTPSRLTEHFPYLSLCDVAQKT